MCPGDGHRNQEEEEKVNITGIVGKNAWVKAECPYCHKGLSDFLAGQIFRMLQEEGKSMCDRYAERAQDLKRNLELAQIIQNLSEELKQMTNDLDLSLSTQQRRIGNGNSGQKERGRI